MIGKAIYSLLSSDSTVSTLATGGIFPVRAKQTTPNPCVIYNLYEYPEDDKDGRATIRHHDLQVDVYTDLGDTGISDAHDLEDAIKEALDRYTGTVQTIEIQTIIHEGSRMGFDDESDAYRVMMRFRVRENVSYVVVTEGVGYWVIGTDFIVQ